jgi:hypothetical protein
MRGVVPGQSADARHPTKGRGFAASRDDAGSSPAVEVVQKISPDVTQFTVGLSRAV